MLVAPSLKRIPISKVPSRAERRAATSSWLRWRPKAGVQSDCPGMLRAQTIGITADINGGSIPPKTLASQIAAMDLGFDQIILEYDAWIHVGLSEGKPRGQLLTVRTRTGYVEGIV